MHVVMIFLMLAAGGIAVHACGPAEPLVPATAVAHCQDLEDINDRLRDELVELGRAYDECMERDCDNNSDVTFAVRKKWPKNQDSE
jgi:hypothetical protein